MRTAKTKRKVIAMEEMGAGKRLSSMQPVSSTSVSDRYLQEDMIWKYQCLEQDSAARKFVLT